MLQWVADDETAKSERSLGKGFDRIIRFSAAFVQAAPGIRPSAPAVHRA